MADVLRVLGDPGSVATPDGELDSDPNRIVWLEYDRVDPMLGPVTVSIRARDARVMWIMQLPTGLTVDEAKAKLGPHPISVRYQVCPDFEESAPFYPAADGVFQTLEYRRQGIALVLDGEGTVDEIHYVSRDGYGLRSKRECKRELARERRRWRP